MNSFRDVTFWGEKTEKKKERKINAVILEEPREGIPYRGGTRSLFIVTLKKNDEIKRGRLNEVEQEGDSFRHLEPSLRQPFFAR